MHNLTADNVLILGDVHGNFGGLKEFIHEASPDLVLQCGDFGVWPPGGIGLLQQWFSDLECDLYFCPGNHEWWDELDALESGKIHQVAETVFYCAFGSTLRVNDDTVLFAGGADSIDKGSRTEKLSWWKQEIITEQDMRYLPDCRVDVVVSHTAPDAIHRNEPKIQLPGYRDPSTTHLETILNRYRPSLWYFGHFHQWLHGRVRDCTYYGLDQLGRYPRCFHWHTQRRRK